MHQRLGRLGKTARMFCEESRHTKSLPDWSLPNHSTTSHTTASHCVGAGAGGWADFEYGPGCNDWAGWMPNNPYSSKGGWASHGAEIAFVFSNPTAQGGGGGGGVCNVSAESPAAARLATLIPALWTSFAATGTPRADPSLFTTGGDAEDQWPACGPDATIGSSSNEPVLVLGVETVGIVRGLKDEDCVLMHEHIKQRNANIWAWLKGVCLSALSVGAAAAAVRAQKLPSPTGQLPEKVRCEGAARVSVITTLVVSLLAALLPWISPNGSYPFVIAVCCACALLRRDPRVVCGTSTLAFFVGLWHIEFLLVFAGTAPTSLSSPCCNCNTRRELRSSPRTSSYFQVSRTTSRT